MFLSNIAIFIVLVDMLLSYFFEKKKFKICKLMEEIQKRDQEPIDEQIIELYNSSALEILNRERKIITDRGDIDFQALDTFYRENRGSIAQFNSHY